MGLMIVIHLAIRKHLLYNVYIKSQTQSMFIFDIIKGEQKNADHFKLKLRGLC